MKTKFTLILVLILAAASFWFFKYQNQTDDLSLEKLVPQSSVALITTSDPQQTIKNFSGYSWWNALSKIPFLTNSDKQLKSIQSLIDNNELQTKLNQLDHVVSLHITANDQIETLHFIKSDGFLWSENSVNKILELLSPENPVKINQRTYEEMSINEFQLEGDNFSYLIIDDFLVYSSNAILIEDVIRTASEQTPSLFEYYNSKISKNNDFGLVINTGKLKDLERVFFLNTTDTYDNELQGLLQLSITYSDGALNFNGLIQSSTKGNTEEQLRDVAINERHYLPNTLSAVSIIGIPRVDDPRQMIGSFNLNEFINKHKGSLTIVEMDGGGIEKELAILAIVDDPKMIKQKLDELALTLVKDETDTLYQEAFMGAYITYLDKPGIINDFYATNLLDFKQSYYSVYNDVLIISESVDMIKLILSEYDNENTWGKTVSKRKFLDQLISEASYTKLINFQFSVDALKANLKPKWKQFFDEQQQLLNLVDLVAIQLSKSGNGYYSSSQVTLNALSEISTDPTGVLNSSNDLVLVSNTFADSNIISKPFVVRNHNNSRQEILLQDDNKAIYLISKQGTVIWKMPFSLSINGKVSQVDYYNNKKLQYLFSTDSALHIIDRNGEYIDGFPKIIKTELPLLDISVVDYDNSKRYRFIGMDRRGNTYLFDKQGNLLDGWNPLIGSSAMLQLPMHIRVRGKDCFIFVSNEGTIDLTNRKGESYNGFPYKVGKRLSGDIKVTKGPSFNTTVISVITEEGQLLNLDLNGVVKDKNQLFKPTLQSKFSLTVDRLGTDFIVVRKDKDSTIIFDSSGKESFTLDIALDKDDQINFYNFRNESELFLVNKNGQLFIFDKFGKPKFSTELKTDYQVGVVYYQSRGEYELFINFDNQFAIYTFTK